MEGVFLEGVFFASRRPGERDLEADLEGDLAERPVDLARLLDLDLDRVAFGLGLTGLSSSSVLSSALLISADASALMSPRTAAARLDRPRREALRARAGFLVAAGAGVWAAAGAGADFEGAGPRFRDTTTNRMTKMAPATSTMNVAAPTGVVSTALRFTVGTRLSGVR